jgi:F-type H+-transporting ATPase subunit a
MNHVSSAGRNFSTLELAECAFAIKNAARHHRPLHRMRLLHPAIAIFSLGLALPLHAAGDGGHHVVPLYAQPLFGAFTNSTIMVWLSVALIVLFCQVATRKMKLVPAGFQNFAEWVVETLYDFLEGLLGAHLTKRVFWFYGSIFFFILVNNYMALMPGVGTVGWVDEHGYMVTPWLRGANADINMTSAMAFTFALLWFYWALTENGLKAFLAHIFAPKGNFKGVMLVAMVPVFLFVGVLELISIAIRPVALTFRLFGNIYGGEQTKETLMGLLPKYLAFLPALPFYFMELLVGFVQAFVFTLLCAIFLKLICEHGDGEHH